MEFKELIEVRRSCRKYVASEISKAEVEVIVGGHCHRQGGGDGGETALL